MASSSTLKPSVGILSIGDMGMGIAKLLIAHDYPVLTVSEGRSQHTKDRIRAASIKDVPSDEALVSEADIIFSIVPPRDALATARRVAEACKVSGKSRLDIKGLGGNITYFDLNAISPRTSKSIAAIFARASPPGTPRGSEGFVRRLSRSLSSAGAAPRPDDAPLVEVKYMDGGIIGGPPSKQSDGTWKKPSVPISGPEEVAESLMSVMNMKLISQDIGPASALKACFASLTKGFTALSILSYTTAKSSGVLEDLQTHLDEYAPGVRQRAENGIVGMCPKAYRWTDEMKQIGETFVGQGGLEQGQKIYDAVGELYRFVAEDTVLGKEKVGKRKRGTTAEDVAACVEEGVLMKKRKANGGGDEKLELAWRSSWS